MIYLSGQVDARFANRPDAGFMLQPGMGNRPNLSNTLWAADHGQFRDPDWYDFERHYEWLIDRMPYQRTNLFVTLPDSYGRADVSMDMALAVLPEIKSLGYSVALVAQDGTEQLPVPWALIDALFIGGTNPWRESAPCGALAAEAKRNGKWLHLGRVSSLRRLETAQIMGCDSADGTAAAFAPDKIVPQINGWLAKVNGRPAMALWQNPRRRRA